MNVSIPYTRSDSPRRTLIAITLLLLAVLLLARSAGPARADAEPHLGYGFNVATWDIGRLQSMGFDWIKVFSAPSDRLPVRVLVRVDANAAAASAEGIAALQQEVGALARNSGPYIEAYEIGNEVNLDASYGWNAPPIAADYVRVLCAAYSAIHANDSLATVVSAGLAPVGRVSGNWEGHAGHNGAYQDEREYLREFLDAGGADCADAIGYHPYGFSANYDAAPDIASADPDLNCANGFCFRGAEPIHDILLGAGEGDLPVWATEFGWLVAPPAECLSHASFQGREWQLVTEEEQATNLAGAFAYAGTHWPWMGPMFVFNLNFNQVSWYEACEQMRYYAVQGRPAETALSAMTKNPVRGILEVDTSPRVFLAAASEQPLALEFGLRLGNRDIYPLTYVVSVPAGPFTISATPAVGELQPGANADLLLTIEADGLATGSYAADVVVGAGDAVQGAPATVPVRLYLLDRLERVYLPLVP